MISGTLEPATPATSHSVMAAKLTQKHLFKGTQEFEIVDNTINVRIRKPFKEERLSVVLSILNPEPVINNSYLEFHSRVQCGPLISLYLNKPNVEEFNAFVGTLKQRALEEYNAFTGINSSAQPAGLAANLYDEPPEFEDAKRVPITNVRRDVDVERLDVAIRMLERYLDSEDAKPLISALGALKEDPQNESHLLGVVDAFNALGSTQGAVLTYAPYLSILLADDAFGTH